MRSHNLSKRYSAKRTHTIFTDEELQELSQNIDNAHMVVKKKSSGREDQIATENLSHHINLST